MNINSMLKKFESGFDLAGRVLMAYVFMGSGIRKISGSERWQALFEDRGLAPELLPLVIITEISCALALVLGWQTRAFALLLAGFTVIATYYFHMDWETHFSVYLLFVKNIAIFGGLLFIVGHGAGAWSLDARLSKK